MASPIVSRRGALVAAVLVVTGCGSARPPAVGSPATATPLSSPVTPVASSKAASFGWGPEHAAGPDSTWNYGRSMAVTASGGTDVLHVTFATDRLAGIDDSAAGRDAIGYIRSDDGGATWSEPLRLDAATDDSSRGALAAAGDIVHAVWVTTTDRFAFGGSGRRVLVVRTNVAGAWRDAVRLTDARGRVDYPTVAASGGSAYVAFTDASTGDIRVAMSHDRGSSWSMSTIGSTTNEDPSGRLGVPVIAAVGDRVAVAWIATDEREIRVRISGDEGATWGDAVDLGRTRTLPDIAAAGERVVVAWKADRIRLKVATGDAWGDAIDLPSRDTDRRDLQYQPAVALLGGNGVGVAYASCIGGCGGAGQDTSTRSELVWRRSADGGTTWDAPAVVGSSSDPDRRRNDGPSVASLASGLPIVLWNAWTAASASHRLYVRAGG